MSAIGTSHFFLLGYFYGVPLYQPLWPVQINLHPFDKRGANAEPGQLVLGGGSGEHPAIIFRDVEYCVADLLCSKWSPVCQDMPHEIRKHAGSPASEAPRDALEFCQWTAEDHQRFREMCAHDYALFADKNSFAELDEEVFVDEDGTEFRNPPCTSLELWLCFNIGEFVYAALPGLTPKIQRWRDALGPIQRPWFRGILIQPPGYPDEGGRPEDQQETDPEKAKTHGGAPRFKVVDRFPGYHRAPEW